MVVIADTSPLNYLVLTEYAEVLPHLYGQVVIPHAVLQELLHPNAPPAVARWIAAAPAWLVVDQNVRSLPDVQVDLDSGESAAIALAQANQPDVLLLIDEVRGREQAMRLGIRTTGTLGILDAAAANGLLDLRSALQTLRATNFYVSSGILSRLLEKDVLRRKLRDRT
jgi:predicted nucleic acid-binding protein